MNNLFTYLRFQEPVDPCQVACQLTIAFQCVSVPNSDAKGSEVKTFGELTREQVASALERDDFDLFVCQE